MVSKASMILALALIVLFATSTCLGMEPMAQDVQAQGLRGLRARSLLNFKDNKLPSGIVKNVLSERFKFPYGQSKDGGTFIFRDDDGVKTTITFDPQPKPGNGGSGDRKFR